MDLGTHMVMEFVTRVSAGNIGALTCTMQLLENNPMSSSALIRALDLGIIGDKLYLVWNDCCDRDTNKTVQVLLEKSKEEILEHIDMQKNMGRGKPFEE